MQKKESSFSPKRAIDRTSHHIWLSYYDTSRRKPEAEQLSKKN